jgi:hypothetical protein
MAIKQWMQNLVHEKVSIAPLVTFRVLFGLVIFASIVRFWMNGWIKIQFIDPIFHFKYFGFYWLPEPSAFAAYGLFALMALSALAIAFGAFYRFSTIAFFLSFSYVELIDVSYYLNHYYFVSLVSGLMIFLPANRALAIDIKLGLAKPSKQVSAIAINLVKFQLAMVYLFAGIAKLNADWLFHAMPLAIWLPAQDHLPLIGWLFDFPATAYVFSWAGAIYDLVVAFFLLWNRTRWIAYAAVVVFHLLTWSLFQIGMFPFIMIASTLIFFSPEFHERIQQFLIPQRQPSRNNSKNKMQRWVYVPIIVFVGFQLVFPFRHLLYSGNPFWHEQGYRFGWRVMLMEKAGYAQFHVHDSKGRVIDVQNSDFLTPVQEKMMSTQPDLMLQFAHFLTSLHQSNGIEVTGVFADVYVT